MQADGGEDEVVGQHTLLPSLTVDPKLWLVKCLSGQERQCVTQLMQKFIHHQMKRAPLAIVSAFCLDTLAGTPLPPVLPPDQTPFGPYLYLHPWLLRHAVGLQLCEFWTAAESCTAPALWGGRHGPALQQCTLRQRTLQQRTVERYARIAWHCQLPIAIPLNRADSASLGTGHQLRHTYQVACLLPGPGIVPVWCGSSYGS